MSVSRFALVIIVLAVLCSTAMGQTFRVQVTRASVGPCVGGIEYDSGNLASGTNVNISLSTCAMRVNITASSNAANIGRITLTNGPATGFLDVVFGTSSSINFSDAATVQVGNNWSGLDTSALSSNVTVRMSGTIGGNLTGSVRVGQLLRFDVLGEVRAQIRSTIASATSIVETSAITSSGSVVMDAGTIQRVRALTGSIAGPITSSAGRINDVRAPNGSLLVSLTSYGSINSVDVGGDIGTPTNPVSITTVGNGANIDLVRAANIYATITTPNTSTLRGDTKQVIATTGNFVGGLTTYALQGTALNIPAISVAGDMDANIHVETVKRPIIIGGSLLQGRSITVMQDVKVEGPISFAQDGLVGQVVINRSNAFTNAWAGTISIGSLILSPAQSQPNRAPFYQHSSGDLGGGSIGVGAFVLNRHDCSPVSLCVQAPCWTAADAMPIITQSAFLTTGVKLRFYGPITLNSSSPIALYRSAAANPWGYPDIAIDPTDIDFTTESNAGIVRTLVVKRNPGSTLANGRYTIVYNASSAGILCNGISGSPSVGSFNYSFIISDDNPGPNDQFCGSSDFDCDGDVGTDRDIEAFFACLAGLCPGAPCSNTSDFDGDGDFGTDADIEAFFRVLAGGRC